MGCFSIFHCFSTSNHRKEKKTLSSAFPSSSNQGSERCADVLLAKPTEESTNLDSILKSISHSSSRGNGEDQLISSNKREKVTFDSNVKTYANDVSFEEVRNHSVESQGLEVDKEKAVEGGTGKLGVLVKIEINKEREKEEKEERKLNQVQDQAYSDSSVSSYISYPPMHRYHNCSAASDEEDDVLIEEEESDLFSLSIESHRPSKPNGAEVDDKEVSSPLKTSRFPELKTTTKSIEFIPDGRDQSQHNDSVLNPIENHSHWNMIKVIPVPTSEDCQEKENICLEQELSIPLSKEPNLKKVDQKEKISNGNVVATSFSSWLVESEKTTTTSKEDSQNSVGNSYSYSDGANSANSWKSFEDRPILGAMTIEEVRQISAKSSPRKSPRRNPDEMPIIGTVGSYWSHTGQGTAYLNSCSIYQKKSGNPRKNREDKIPSCHSTPSRRTAEGSRSALDRGTA